ncbi:unnamed protein product [Mucor circinelloides]
MSKPTYIRAKREKTTLFLCIEPKDSLEQVKTKLCQALENKKTNDEVRLLVDGKTKGDYSVLENTKTLENNSIVYYVYYDRNDGNESNSNQSSWTCLTFYNKKKTCRAMGKCKCH